MLLMAGAPSVIMLLRLGFGLVALFNEVGPLFYAPNEPLASSEDRLNPRERRYGASPRRRGPAEKGGPTGKPNAGCRGPKFSTAWAG